MINSVARLKTKLLSAGGKEVLLKVVAQALPSNDMSIFKLPKKVCWRLMLVKLQFW